MAAPGSSPRRPPGPASRRNSASTTRRYWARSAICANAASSDAGDFPLNRPEAGAKVLVCSKEEMMPTATAAKPKSRTSGHGHKVSGQKIAHGRAAEPVLVKGRRDFFKYRDLGVADASAGTMRAQVMSSSQG